MTEKPTFFETAGDFRAWLESNHDTAAELWVGYYKVATRRLSITWAESVDEALCYGWIDGIRKKHDEISYKVRFTPRRATSIWSARNVERVEAMTKLGRMQSPGIAAFERRKNSKTGVYGVEQYKEARLSEEFEERFRQHEAAWSHFESMPPGYRRTAIFWVMSAKREETRDRRLSTLIEDSANERKVKPLRRPGE